MAPADLFLLPKIKLPLQGTRFQSIEDGYNLVPTRVEPDSRAIFVSIYNPSEPSLGPGETRGRTHLQKMEGLHNSL